MKNLDSLLTVTVNINNHPYLEKIKQNGLLPSKMYIDQNLVKYDNMYIEKNLLLNINKDIEIHDTTTKINDTKYIHIATILIEEYRILRFTDNYGKVFSPFICFINSSICC